MLNGGSGNPAPLLLPLISVPSTGSIQEAFDSVATPLAEIERSPDRPWPRRISLFLIKSSLHVFLISVFETVFFFQYVSITENNGILKTINTYYGPLQASCYGWSNFSRWAVREVLDDVFNQTLVDAASAAAMTSRNSFNTELLVKSLSVSGVCLGVLMSLAAALRWRRIPVPWLGVLIENLMMVVLLGLYEYFFFRAIIYNYDTISTPELNAYLLDGLWSCTGASGP